MKRLDQIVLIITFLGFSWLTMQAIHELGHVLGALASGGQVVKVILHPLTISGTFVSPNPHPLCEVWAGPMVGALLPLLALLLASGLRSPGIYLFRFFAGFCLIANGAYIGRGTFAGMADSAELLSYGAQRWQLLLFGVIAVTSGLYLWNGLGPSFGLGEAKGKVSRAAAITSLILLVAIVGIEMAIGSR
jgi:hypothetical protein